MNSENRTAEPCSFHNRHYITDTAIRQPIKFLPSCTNRKGQISPKTCLTFTSFLVLILIFGKAGISQDKSKEIDAIFNWTKPDAPGCVCAVSQNGKVMFNRAYGSADLERNVPLATSSVFDAGSLVKQFIAASALILVEEGKLTLSDDVRKFVPELPDYGYRITLDHLLTHTSGIRDWTGIMPFTDKSTDALKIVLRQRGLNFIPGEEWSYSNSGYVLLREIIARVSGMTFAEFTSKRLFEPLGMESTGYHHDLKVIIKNRTMAYEKNGREWRQAVLLDNERGGQGALFTTAADLLIWNDALENKRLGNAVSKFMHTPAKLTSGRPLGYARGLFIDSVQNSPFWWHSGSADGYKALLANFPGQKLSIAILCNSGDDTDRTGFARRIYNLFSGQSGRERSERESLPPPTAEGYNASDPDLGNRAGLYFNESTGEAIRLVTMNGRLRIMNGPFLVASAADLFKRWGNGLNFMSGDQFTLYFNSQNGFELKTMEGKKILFRKAETYAPGADELKSFTGRFVSDEMGAVFVIEQKGDGLMVHMEHAPERGFEIKPTDKYTFQRGMLTLRFHRDKSGTVTSFDFSNPLIRKIPFSRWKDQTIKP